MVGVLGFCWIMSRSSRRVCSETWVAPFIRYCFFAATQRQCHSTWGVPQFFRNQRTFRIATRVQTNTRIIQILNFGNVVVLLESSRVRDLPHTLSEFWDNHATSKERAGFLKTKNRKSDNSRNKKKTMPTNRTDENKTIQELEPKNKRTKNVKPRQFWRGPRVPGSAEPDWPPWRWTRRSNAPGEPELQVKVFRNFNQCDVNSQR